MYRLRYYRLFSRTISAPLIWFPRLSKATKEQLNTWELLGDGEGIHWPEIDENLSIAGLLIGTHSIKRHELYLNSKLTNISLFKQ